MAQLNETGRYEVSKSIKDQLGKLFASGYCDDAQTQKVIGAMWKGHHYLIDPHTAVAFDVLDQYRKESGDTTPAIVVSTAYTYIYSATMCWAPGRIPCGGGHRRAGSALQAHRNFRSRAAGRLKEKRVRFHQSVTKEHMKEQVLEMLL